MPLPPLPGHRVRVDSSKLPPERDRGFLNVRRLEARVAFTTGETSASFVYDCVERAALDAIVVVPHYRAASGERFVVLRSALRPPVATRPREVWPMPEPEHLGELWEVPAGLVEADERSPDGLRRCASRELHEETGFDVAAERIAPLGPSMFPAPGMVGERHFYFHAEVDPASRVTPPEDGSALERHAAIVDVSLAEALEACRTGQIEDAKTELALRRLAELVQRPRAEEPR
ncbi:MAG: NUDIX hydrolase [Polyangiaceae bacterium]